MFARKAGIINIKIDINKTIESLKKEIFEHLNLKIAYFYNIRLYSTTPTLGELSVHSKTVAQCGILESSVITVTAQHGFCFEELPSGVSNYFALPNNAMSFVNLRTEPLPKIANPNVPIVIAEV